MDWNDGTGRLEYTASTLRSSCAWRTAPDLPEIPKVRIGCAWVGESPCDHHLEASSAITSRRDAIFLET